MNINNGALYFGAGIDTAQFRRDIDSMRRDILGLSQSTVQETRNMDSAFKNLSLGIAGAFSLGAVKSFVMELINVRGEFQKTEIAFTTMLGNADQAKVLMGQMVDLAAKTPFGLQDVSSGAKQLLAFQVPANEVVDVLTRMGNIAAGLGVPLSRINLVYGQVKAKGKLAGDDLRQFTEAGIPMVAELAKKFNKTTGEITNMVSAGKIGFKDVQDVLYNLTNEGGMFFNLMEKQSASLSGKIANLGDSWDQMLNKMGEASDGILSNGIESITYLVEHYQKVLEIIEGLVVAYGAYKAAVIVTSAAQALGNRTIASEIALLSISEKMKLGRAMVTQRQAEATLAEAQAERSALQIKYATLQAEVSSLAVKKQKAIALAMEKAQALGNAQVQLALAKAELRSVTANGTAREILIATKNVEKAQNIVIAAQEEATIARKGALTVATEFQTKQVQVKTTATALSAAANTVETATETAQTAAKTANTIATTRLTLATTLRTAATRLATTAQALLNATMLDNPIVLVIAAAVALTYAYFKLRDTSTAASIAEKQLNDERQRSSKLIEELKNKTQELISVINSDTSTKLQQLEAYKAMQKMYPDLLSKMALETFKKLDSTEAQKKLNAEMDKFSTQNIQTNIEKAKKSIEQYTAKIKELNDLLKKRNGDSGIYLNQLEIAKKNLEAQKINLEKYNEEYRQRLENEKLSSMSTAEQKKYWQDIEKSILNEISSLEKSNAKKAEAIDKVNNIHSLVKSTSIGLINWNINPLLSQLNKAQSEINKINNAQSGASVNINKAHWELQKKEAEDDNDAMSGRGANPAVWDANIKKIREATEQLKKYDYTDKEALKAQKERDRERNRLEKGAEKSYLAGSISRIDQEISLLEEALKRSSGNTVRLRYIDKYGKERFSKELSSVEDIKNQIIKKKEEQAAREKLIEVKSFQERTDEAERQWNNYYRMAEFYGKETAEAQYKDLFQGSQTYLDYLDKQEQALKDLAAKGIISPQQRADLVLIAEKKRSLTGEETPFENWKRDIDNALKSLPSLVDQVEKLEEAEEQMRLKEGKNTPLYLQSKKYLKEQKINILQQQQDTYNEFLKEQQKFEDKKLIIQEKYENIRKQLGENSSKYTDKQLLELLDKSYNAESKEIADATFENLQKSELWVKAFEDLGKVGPRTLQRLKKSLQDIIDTNKQLSATDLKVIQDQIIKIDEAISSKDPFAVITNSVIKYREEKKKLADAERKHGKDSKEYNNQLEVTRNALANIFKDAQSAANAVVGFTIELGGALGILSQESQEALKNAQQLFDGIMNAVTGYLSGDYVKMAGGIMQMITSMSKAMNGDVDREKSIKQWSRAIDELKYSYEQLNKTIEKTAGEAQLKMQRDLIGNLKEQQRLLVNMRRMENEKKGSDTDKIASYSQQINEINDKIAEIADNFKKSITTTEFKDLSQKIADALIDAFGKGEDAAKSFDKVVDDVMKSAVQNALKMKFLDEAAQNMVNELYNSMGFGNGDISGIEKQLKNAQDRYRYLTDLINNSAVDNIDAIKAKFEKEELEKLINSLKQQISQTQTAGGFDGLTPEERDRIKALGEDAMKKYMEALKQYQDLFGQSAENAQGLKGDIKGLTEKTGGALEGQFNAIRINVSEVLKIMKVNQTVANAQTVFLSKIENNTRPIEAMYKEIKELNSKIKKGAAGIP